MTFKATTSSVSQLSSAIQTSAPALQNAHVPKLPKAKSHPERLQIEVALQEVPLITSYAAPRVKALSNVVLMHRKSQAQRNVATQNSLRNRRFKEV